MSTGSPSASLQGRDSRGCGDSKGSLPPTDPPLQEKGLPTRKLHLADSKEKRVGGYITTSGSLSPAPELSLSRPRETSSRTQREACSSSPPPPLTPGLGPEGRSPPGMFGGWDVWQLGQQTAHLPFGGSILNYLEKEFLEKHPISETL